MWEVVKFAGAAAWFAGFIAWWFNPIIGALLILFAAITSAVALMKGARDREARRNRI